MRLKTCATVLMACGLVSSTVAAQTYVSRGYPGETLEAKRALVESSEPTWYVVGRAVSTPLRQPDSAFTVATPRW